MGNHASATLQYPIPLSARLRTADLLPLNFYIYTVPKKVCSRFQL